MTYSIKQVLFDPFNKGAYLLASDGTDSAVWRTEDIYAATPVWTKGTVVSGVYTVIRTTNTAGSILIYAPTLSAGTTTVNFDFTASDGGWTYATGGTPGIKATYIPGTGWSYADNLDGTYRRLVLINKAMGSVTLTAASMVYTLAKGTISDTSQEALRIVTNVGVLQNTNFSAVAEGTNVTYPWIGSSAGTTLLTLLCGSSYKAGAPADYSGNCLITAASYTVNNSAGAAVRYSIDYGISFDAPETIGTTPGSVGGFDTQLAGAVSYAAMAAKVRKTTALGGAYADFINTTGANAVCIIVPWYTRNSTTAKNTTTATPDCLVALDAADSDGGTLYWVAGATGVKTDITPTAGMTFDSADCVTTSYGTHIAVCGKVGGVYHLYTSVNGGTFWTDQGTLTTPHFIRGRRKDTRAKVGGYTGQIYVTNGNTVDYSRDWGATEYPRTMPVTGVLGHDIAG